MRRSLADERGYTLIEMMMATAAGLVVAAATMAILVSAYKFMTNTADRVDANQQGRVAMERIVQLLDSSCVAGLGVSPVVGQGTSGPGPASSATSLTFYGALSDQVTIDPNEYVIFINSAGALELDTYAYAAGPQGAWTFNSTPSQATLVARAAQVPGSSGLFSYYSYNSSGALVADSLTNGTLPGSIASDVAAIGIQFQAQATDGNASPGTAFDLQNQVVLRLLPVSADNYPDNTTTPYPCS